MPRYKVNGRTFNIPDNEVDLFEADFPEAQLHYQTNDGRKFTIYANERKDFLSDFPDATELGWEQAIKEQAKQADPFQPEDNMEKPLFGSVSYKDNIGNPQDSLYYPSPLSEEGRADYEPISAEERSKQEYDMLMRQLDEFNAVNGDMMNAYEAYEQAAKYQVNEGGFAIDTPERRYLDENSAAYHQRKVEKDELNSRIKNNSYFNQMRMAEADAANETVDAISNLMAQNEAENTELHKKMQAMNALAMNPRGSFSGFSKTKEMQEYVDERDDLLTAKRLYENTAQVYAAPINDGEDIFKKFGKGFGQRVDDADFWSLGIVGIADDMNARAAFQKIQDKFGSVKEFANLTDAEIDALLTPSEQLLISAVMDNNAAMYARKDNTAGAYEAGAGAADSLMFMAQFLLTGGVGDAATVGTAAHKRLVSWLGRKVGSMSNGLMKDVVRGAVKLGVGTAESIGKALVMTPLMPHTYANIADKMMSFDDNGELMDVTDAILTGAADALIETWSESTGDFVNKILGVPGGITKGIAKKALKNVDFSDWGKVMNAPMMKILKKGGFNGFLGEMGEEFIGNAVRSISGLEPDAFKEFTKLENLLVTAGSFAPMTVLGLGASSAQYGLAKRKLNNAQKAFESMLRDAGHTEDQAKYIVDELLGSTDAHLTPERLVANFSPLLRELAFNDRYANNRTQTMQAAVDFMWQIARYRTFDGVYHRQEEQQRNDMLAEIQEGTGREFWTTRLSENAGLDGTAYETDEVRAVEFNDGRVAYVLGGDGVNNTVVYNDGQTGFLSEEQLNEGKANGSIVSDATMGLNDYLTQQVARVRMTEEEQRMFAEKNTNIGAIRAQFPIDATVELGTTEAPVQGVVRQQTPDGVIVESPAGISQLTWEELGHTMGIEVNPQTDAQMEEEAINNLEIADLQRRREREQRRAQRNPAAEEALEAEQMVDEAENEGLEKPIPMKADGTVDQTAFWNESPARWAQWKTEQRQDGGTYAATYIQNAIGILEGQIAESEAAFLAESDFDAKDALEQTINQQRQRLAELQDLALQYMPSVIPAETSAEASVEQTQPGAETSQPAVMADRQKFELDAEYQRRLSLAKALAEKEMILKEYFEAISAGSMEAVVMNKQNYKQVMKENGCDEAAIEMVTNAIKFAEEENKAVDALHVNDKIFIVSEYITSIEGGRVSYVHERQHNITKNRPELIQRILSLGLGRETMQKIVRMLSGSKFYEEKSDEVLADEILSFTMEIAYTFDDFSVTLSKLGLPIELINLINEINDEQRKDFTLVNARRNSNALDSGQRDSGQNDGDSGEVSGGILGQEGVRPSEDSERRDETGESGEPATGGAEASEEGLQVPVAEVEEESEEKPEGPDFRVTKPEDNLSDETKQELADKGLVMDGGAIMSEDYAKLKRETGYETPIERNTDLDDLRFSYGTRHAHIANYRQHPEAEKRVIALLERLAERISMNELVYGVMSTATNHKYVERGTGIYAGPLRENVEYVITFDLDTTCPRTFQYLNFVKRIEKRIRRPLTQTECIQLIEMMRMYGQQIPCVYCYAENKRQALKDGYTRFMNARYAVLSAETDEEALQYMYGRNDSGSADPKEVLTKAAHKVFLQWRKDRKSLYNPSMKTLWSQYTFDRNCILSLLDTMYEQKGITTDASDVTITNSVAAELGVTSAKAKNVIEEIVGEWKWDTIEGKEHDDFTPIDEEDWGVNERAFEVWRDMTNYAKSMSSAKGVIRYTPYTDELKYVSQEDRDYVNGMGGVRMHSTNDFRIDYVFDYFQFMADMALYKMFGHTYTKSPEFVRIFGKSGYKINMSIAAYQDENGNIRPNADEGFDWEEAKALRTMFPNAGVMLMATSDEQIQMALDSDWIDMIIPFHNSGLPRSVWYNMRLWSDYQNIQKEKFYNTDYKTAALKADGVIVPKKAKADEIDKLYNEHFGIEVIYDKTGKRIAPHFLPGPTIVDGNEIPGHNNDHQTYLDLCRRYGVKPRFLGMQVKDNTPEGGGRVVDITEHPRYMILVKETARTDTPQTPIQFNFDEPSDALGGRTPLEYAFDELEARVMAESELEGEQVTDIYNSLKKDQFGIVDQFIDTIIKHKEETGKDYPLDYITPQSRKWFLVERKALEEAFKDVETIPYHRNEYDEQGNLTKGEGLEREGAIDLVEEAKKADLRHRMSSENTLVPDHKKGQPMLSDAEMMEDVSFRISKNTDATIRSWCKKAGIEDFIADSLVGYIDERFEDTTAQLCAAKWYLNGKINLPDEDDYKVDEAVKIAKKNKVDALSYNSPMEIIDKFGEIKSKEKAIDPDTVKEFSNKQELPEGIVVYDVQDDFEGQAAVRNVIDTHWGKDANPWCLAARVDGSMEKAKGYWRHYSRYPKRIAFRDGKLLAFFASADKMTWWDRLDDPHEGIPYTVKSKRESYDVTTNYELRRNRKKPVKTGERKEDKDGRYDIRNGISRRIGWKTEGRDLEYSPLLGGSRLRDKRDGVYFGANFSAYGNLTRAIYDKGEDVISVGYTANGDLIDVNVTKGTKDWNIGYRPYSSDVRTDGLYLSFNNKGELTYATAYEGVRLDRVDDTNYQIQLGRDTIIPVKKGEVNVKDFSYLSFDDATKVMRILAFLDRNGWERSDYPAANPADVDILRNNEEFRKMLGEAIKDVNDIAEEKVLSVPEVRFRITAEQDKAYMDAVESGDMDTAQGMVDEAAAAAGYTIRGDHGRVSKFTIFDKEKANPEGNWGQGFYFTNNKDDVENNYASVEGPDLEAKIEREVERRVNLAEMNEEFNEDGEVDEFAIREAVEEEFITSEPNVVHAAIKMDNPFVVGHGMVEIGEDGLGHYDMRETYLTAEYETDEDGEPDYSIDPTGTLVDLVEALNEELSQYEGVNINAYDILSDNIDGMTASQFEKEARELLENSVDYLQNDDLEIMTSEIIRAAIERAGFDGIVDNTVNQKFGTARRFGRAMEGVNENTRHYIAFQSSQIKEADPVTYDDAGNVIPLSERFNPKNSDIRFRFTPRTDEQREQLFDKAKAHYGLTNNFNASGYMLPDGSLLDFSEANDGGDPNRRSLDHRDIEGLIMDEGKEYDSRYHYVVDFVDEGAIRMLPEAAGFQLSVPPTAEQRSKLMDYIYKHNGEVIMEITDENGGPRVYMEYNKRTSPSRIFRDMDGYFNEGVVPGIPPIRFRMSNENQAIFVSNAAKAVEGIKQEKATPEQWLKMIEKNGGLKAGEDKWMGLSDWLKASDKKTLTKDEVLEFIGENMIRIEEQHYDINAEDDAERAHSEVTEKLQDRFDHYEDEYYQEQDWDGETEDARAYAIEKLREEMGDTFPYTIELEYGNVYLTFPFEEEDDLVKWAEKTGVEYTPGVAPINDTRLNYTTDGLENKHEIALTVPTIDRWGQQDDIHFGDAGDGRAVAWVRFGETYTEDKISEINKYLKEKYSKEDFEDGNFTEEDWNKLRGARKQGKKVLVIDEIQSKRHQEGREKGYSSDFEKSTKLQELNAELEQKTARRKELKDYFDSREENELVRLAQIDMELDEVTNVRDYDRLVAERDEINKREENALAEFDMLVNQINELEYEIRREKMSNDIKKQTAIPDAPFDKNWHELAMKRMLRYAAENGYDVIAWTKGEQQAERYGIGNAVSRIESGNAEGFSGTKKIVDIYAPNGVLSSTLYVNEDGKVVSGDYLGQSLSDIVGKEMAVKLMADGEVVIDGDNLRIGGEGMKGFYDRMLPAFMNKYGKKWGVKVEDIDLPNLENGLTMHSVPVTEEMKQSVMEGQVMFRIRAEKEDAMEFTQQVINDCTSRYNEVAEVHVFPENEETAERFGYTMEELKEIGGTYVKEEDIIAIFANKDRNDSLTIENIFFHESIHKLAEFYPEFKKIGEWMWDNSDVIGLQKIKNHIENGYDSEWYSEEMLTYGIAGAMSLGVADRLESVMPKELQGDYRAILNEIGYEPGKESRRTESRISESSRRGAAAMERKTDESGRSKKEEARTGELSAEERRVIGEYFPEFNKGEKEGVSFRAVPITKKVQDEMNAISNNAIENGNYLKAPNGADTNLTPEQWTMVRTKNFINWAGDWINDPENASVILDEETGEPRVLHHGTHWNPQEGEERVFKPSEYATESEGQTLIVGYFSADKTYSEVYGPVSQYYIKMAKPLVMPAKDMTIEDWAKWFEEQGISGVKFDSSLTGADGHVIDPLTGGDFEDGKHFIPFELFGVNDYYVGDGNITHAIARAGYDGIKWTEMDADTYMPFSSSQIKSATDNTGEFSKSEGVSFRFIGEKGAAALDKAEEATVRLDNLAVARQMEEAGKDAGAIKLATGWERGADDLWRYETADFSLKPTWINATTLEEAIKDDELFKAYPELRKTKVRLVHNSTDVGGKFSKAQNSIEAIGYSFESMQDALVHEVQHAIQEQEGFEGGGNPMIANAAVAMEWANKYAAIYDNSPLKKANNAYSDTLDIIGMMDDLRQLRTDRKNSEKIKDTISTILVRLEKLQNYLPAPELKKEFAQRDLWPSRIWDTYAWLDNYQGYIIGLEDSESITDEERKAARIKELMRDSSGIDAYHAITGEVEARNAAKRRAMSYIERRQSLASETEDVAREDHLFIKGALEELAKVMEKMQKGNLSFRTSLELDEEFGDALFKEESTADENGVSFRVVTDSTRIEELEDGPKVEAYRAVQIDKNGKIYSPMASRLKSTKKGTKQATNEAAQMNQWDEAVESLDKVDENGRITILDEDGGTTKVSYNPYGHCCVNSMMNDQFKRAWERDGLYVMKVLAPESELTAGYHAEKAKDAVGIHKWKTGAVGNKLPENKRREILLTRWMKNVKVMPWEEVAQDWIKTLEGENIDVPFNVVPRKILNMLAEAGVKIVAPEKGMENATKAYEQWLADPKGYVGNTELPDHVKALNEETDDEGPDNEPRFRTTGTPTDEVVANGLTLTPAQTAEVAANIFAALPEESRKKITEGLNGNILGLKDAILQIPASLAIKENWNEEDRAMADVVAEEMTKMAGEMTRPFSAPEALWLLYNNLNKGNDLISQASRALVQRNLGFDEETLERQGEAKQGVSFRMVGDATANAKASMYNRGAVNVWTRLKESFVDMQASVEELVSAIEKATGKVAKGFENILLALNQQSSKGLAAMESYEQRFLMPMFDEVRKIMDKAYAGYDTVVRYVILKHGLERNKKLAQRDAKAHYQEIYDEMIAKVNSMDDRQKRTYLTNAQLQDADAKAKLATLKAADTSAYTEEEKNAHKSELAKAKEEVKKAKENLERAQKINSMSEQELKDELDKIFEKIENGTDSVYKELRKNDYSGISSMFYDQLGVNRKDYSTEEEYQAALMLAKNDRFSSLEEVEAQAEGEVSSFEGRVDTKELWKRINAATKETLRQQYEANMISKDQYESLRNMFEYYVPLRGFKDNTAEDMYTYYRKPNSTGYTKPILGAEGRKTEAESPFGWIAAMAGSAIASNVKNEAKLALYYFVSNRPDNGIATLSRTWFVHTPGDVDANGKKIFKPAYPPFSEDLSSDAAKQAYEDWQEQMRDLQKQGLAYEAGQRLNLGNAVVNISDANKPEHVVTVKVAGKDYTIVINGNPRAAQAINGELNLEGTADDYSAIFGPVLRWMSSVNTSYNPEFWITNLMRDMAFTWMAINTKEDPAYRKKFSKNYWKCFRVIGLVAKNEKGTIGNSYIEDMYKDFVKYGGVTGYTQIKDSEAWEKEIDNYLRSTSPESLKNGKMMRGMKTFFHAAHRFGESLEQVSRFAAFLTSREMGKTINEAIADAKEITVNFNRKGSGKMISLEESKYLTDKNGQPLSLPARWAAVGLSSIAPLGRRTIMFFNAAVQGLNSVYRLWQKNPKRLAGWTAAYFAIGVLNAAIHALLDDDDDYLDIPQYERRNSLMLGGNGAYLKWALPQEARAFYALGDLAVETVLGRNPHQNVVGEAMKIATEVLPVNPSEGWKAFVPSVAIPAVELMLNEDYKGAPIYNEQKWLSDEERKRTAKWSSAYQGTGAMYKGIAQGLNYVTGGDKHDAGKINLQPEKMEYIVQSAFGGTIRTADKFINTIWAMFDPEEDVTVRQTPFLNRILTLNDERFKNVHVNEVFDYYKADADHALTLEKKYRKDRDQESLNELRRSDEYQWAKVYRKYKKALDNLKEKLKVAEGTAERKELMRQQDELKRRVIKEISEL